VPSIEERMRGIKGWLELHEAEALERLAVGRVVMEIGSYHGRSTVVMAPVAQKVICIDYFLIEAGAERDETGRVVPPAVKPKTREIFENNVAPWRDKLKVYEMNSLDAVKLDWEPVGLLFIDGGHDYATVVSDCGFLKWVVQGGYAVFHDTSWPSVKAAVQDVMRDKPEWVVAERYSNMTVYRKMEGDSAEV